MFGSERSPRNQAFPATPYPGVAMGNTPLSPGLNQEPLSSPLLEEESILLSNGERPSPSMFLGNAPNMSRQSALMSAGALPSPMNSIEISDDNGPLIDASIENELLQSGFVPKDKIITTDDNGERHARFIKVISRMGQSALVEIDINGYMVVQPKDQNVVASKAVSQIPYSVKMGTYDCAKTDVCGVAFVCDKDICVLNNDPTGRGPQEKNFVYVAHNNIDGAADGAINKAVVISGNPVAYPIIRMSEVRANPGLCIKAINEATRRIRNAAYEASHADLVRLDQSIHDLDKEYHNFKAYRDLAVKGLMSSIKQLEQFNAIYIANPPVCDDEREKHRRVIANLRARHERVIDLLRISEEVAMKRDKIAKLSQEFASASCYIKKEFAELDRDIADEI